MEGQVVAQNGDRPVALAAPQPHPPRRLQLDRRYVARIIVRAALTSDAAVGAVAASRLLQVCAPSFPRAAPPLTSRLVSLPHRSVRSHAASPAQVLLTVGVLAKSAHEHCDNGDLLRLWLAVFAGRSALLVRLLYTRHTLYARGAARRFGGSAALSLRRARCENFKNRLDGLGMIWFVLGFLWLFGSVDNSCATNAPLLSTLTLSYLLLTFASLFLPILFFAGLVCFLPLALAFLNRYGEALGVHPPESDVDDESEGAVQGSLAWIDALPTQPFQADGCPLLPPPLSEGGKSKLDLEAGTLLQLPPLPESAEPDTAPAAAPDCSTAASEPAPGVQNLPAVALDRLAAADAAAAAEEEGEEEEEGDCEQVGGSFGGRRLEAEDALCVVCLGGYRHGTPVVLLPSCSHHFHQRCISAWLRVNASCPLCKARVGPGAEAQAGEGGAQTEEVERATDREAYLRAAVRGGDDLLAVLV